MSLTDLRGEKKKYTAMINHSELNLSVTYQSTWVKQSKAIPETHYTGAWILSKFPHWHWDSL